eukprot:3647359-Prymnesium_polylepis.2
MQQLVDLGVERLVPARHKGLLHRRGELLVPVDLAVRIGRVAAVVARGREVRVPRDAAAGLVLAALVAGAPRVDSRHRLLLATRDALLHLWAQVAIDLRVQVVRERAARRVPLAAQRVELARQDLLARLALHRRRALGGREG